MKGSCWQHPLIKRESGHYRCSECGHVEARDGTSRPWGQIIRHITQAHPEQRLINKGRTA